MQLLLKQRVGWRGESVVWLPRLKADAQVRYLTAKAASAGVRPGNRYGAVLGVVPDLLAGTTDECELLEADRRVVEILRRFSPEVRRRSEQIESGLYLLDASGLSKAFGGMANWARELLKSLSRAGWEGRLALGFTAFATEMATSFLSFERPIRLYQSRQQEEKNTLNTPLTVFSLNPEQVERLSRFEVSTLGDFLALEPDEVKRRFGGELLEFYHKAVGAIFCTFAPLPEPEPMLCEFGFADPVGELEPILSTARRLLAELLPRVVKAESAVAVVHLRLLTEDNRSLEQCLRPTAPTADLNWLMKLVRLRLERYFQRNPLRWGSRVERLIVEVEGEADPEQQGELFTDWALELSSDSEERLTPRDKQAGLRALSQVRAEFGDGCLLRAHLHNHHLPERDHVWRAEREDMSWLSSRQRGRKQTPTRFGSRSSELDVRVRRMVPNPVELSGRASWEELHGPYVMSGGWWEGGYAREYYLAQKERQTAWIFRELKSGRWYVQGWLQ